ncbi:hypothetical protein BpHYR1_050229 [Brachionus plicatilis]|uniref:RRM domain-containing protein n=1 Tax=Brachionus plicatilis TaxID=10195 RepID=A0A3M7RJP2_BRAPC|nr:hypothetical protein BpHYR1_050229 [Brachionus plicatilis]
MMPHSGFRSLLIILFENLFQKHLTKAYYSAKDVKKRKYSNSCNYGFVKFSTKEQNKFKINSVNAEWCNIQSCINCKSLLMILNKKYINMQLTQIFYSCNYNVSILSVIMKRQYRPEK